jgi:hypothetical protein
VDALGKCSLALPFLLTILTKLSVVVFFSVFVAPIFQWLRTPCIRNHHKHYQCVPCGNNFHGPECKSLFEMHLKVVQENANEIKSETPCDGTHAGQIFL